MGIIKDWSNPVFLIFIIDFQKQYSGYSFWTGFPVLFF